MFLIDQTNLSFFVSVVEIAQLKSMLWKAHARRWSVWRLQYLAVPELQVMGNRSRCRSVTGFACLLCQICLGRDTAAYRFTWNVIWALSYIALVSRYEACLLFYQLASTGSLASQLQLATSLHYYNAMTGRLAGCSYLV